MLLQERLMAVLNRVAKWRSHFAGWQLGTRPSTDPECQAVRDHREATTMLRIEVNALTRLLLEKGVALEEFQQALIDEAESLDRDYMKRWPGCRATDNGMAYTKDAVETMKGWRA